MDKLHKIIFSGRDCNLPDLRPGSDAAPFISRTKYMNSLASESVRNAHFNLKRLSRSFCLAQPGISPLERLWNGFDSDARLFMYWIIIVHIL